MQCFNDLLNGGRKKYYISLTRDHLKFNNFRGPEKLMNSCINTTTLYIPFLVTLYQFVPVMAKKGMNALMTSY